MESVAAAKRKSPSLPLFLRGKWDRKEIYPSLKKRGKGRFSSHLISLMQWGLLTLLWLFVAPLAQVSAQGVSLEAAKKEGKVYVYGTIIPQVMKLIEAGFEAKYGVNIEYWRGDATKVVDRVLTEWRAGKPGFDMVIGARGPLALAKADGVYVCARQGADLGGERPLQARSGELLAGRQGCPPRGGI